MTSNQAPRRPNGYWAEVNCWGRQFLEEHLRRPTAEEMRSYYNDNIDRLFPDENDRPDFPAFRVHIKALKTVQVTRERFRAYRAGKRAAAERGEGEEQDETAGEDQDYLPSTETFSQHRQHPRRRRKSQPQPVTDEAEYDGDIATGYDAGSSKQYKQGARWHLAGRSKSFDQGGCTESQGDVEDEGAGHDNEGDDSGEMGASGYTTTPLPGGLPWDPSLLTAAGNTLPADAMMTPSLLANATGGLPSLTGLLAPPSQEYLLQLVHLQQLQLQHLQLQQLTSTLYASSLAPALAMPIINLPMASPLLSPLAMAAAAAAAGGLGAGLTPATVKRGAGHK